MVSSGITFPASGWKEYQEARGKRSLSEAARQWLMRVRPPAANPSFCLPPPRSRWKHSTDTVQKGYEEDRRGSGRAGPENKKRQSLKALPEASLYALSKGIIIATQVLSSAWTRTQLIHGRRNLHPDSSRFWPLQEVRARQVQPSLDKQLSATTCFEAPGTGSRAAGPAPATSSKQTARSIFRDLHPSFGKPRAYEGRPGRLHVHSSNSSDGDLRRPPTFSAWAKEKGLAADLASPTMTPWGLPRALEWSAKSASSLIPSVEMTTLYEGAANSTFSCPLCIGTAGSF